MNTFNQYSFLIVLFFSLCSISCTSINSETEEEAEEYPLAVKMGYYQRYTQKLGLAGNEQNWQLADFYLHEIHEISEDLVDEKVVYDGYEIGVLVNKMLEPAIEKMEKTIEQEDSMLFKTNYKMLINNCNACHTATKHQYIKIIAPKENPYNQDFK